MKTIAYASFCCQKDRERSFLHYQDHMYSHGYVFDEKFHVFQRCEPFKLATIFNPITIGVEDYSTILGSYGIQYPNETYSELTHGFSGPHFWAHHMVNHLAAARFAKSEYIVFADGDCFMESQPIGKNWVIEGIKLLESDPTIFCVSPSDGRPTHGKDPMMSQQMFLVNRKQFMEMEFIPWDGKFIEGGPFQEFYALLEGFIYRHMKRSGLYRYLLPIEYRWRHLEWH